MTQPIFFEMNFDMRLKQGPIQTNLKDPNNFQRLKWVECRKWLKYPSMWILQIILK